LQPNDLIVLRNKEEDQKGRGEGLGGVEDQQGRQMKMEAQTDSTSFQFRTTGTARTKTDAQVAYGVGFGRTWYGWKDKFRSPLGARPVGLAQPKPLLAAAAAIVRLWVFLRFILSRTVVAVHRFMKPQLVRLIIHLQSHFN